MESASLSPLLPCIVMKALSMLVVSTAYARSCRLTGKHVRLCWKRQLTVSSSCLLTWLDLILTYSYDLKVNGESNAAKDDVREVEKAQNEGRKG